MNGAYLVPVLLILIPLCYKGVRSELFKNISCACEFDTISYIGGRVEKILQVSGTHLLNIDRRDPTAVVVRESVATGSKNVNRIVTILSIHSNEGTLKVGTLTPEGWTTVLYDNTPQGADLILKELEMPLAMCAATCIMVEGRV